MGGVIVVSGGGRVVVSKGKGYFTRGRLHDCERGRPPTPHNNNKKGVGEGSC